MNRITFVLGIGTLLCGSHPALSVSPPIVKWQRSYGGSGGDGLSQVRPTADHGFIAAGTSDSPPDGNKTSTNGGASDIWVIRLDSHGDKVWEKTYGGTNSEIASDVEQTRDGGFILTGTSRSGVSGNKTTANLGEDDAWIVRLDASGNILWDQTFGGTNADYAAYAQETPDGGFIVAGGSTQGGGNKSADSYGGFDYWIIRLDQNGNKLWDRSFGGPNDDYLGLIKSTSDGGFILGGTSNSGPSGNKTSPCFGETDMWILKLDADGNKLWELSLGGDSFDAFSDLIETRKGQFVIVGLSTSGVSGNKTTAHPAGDVLANDGWMVMVDARGQKMWDHSYGGKWESEFARVIELKTGGFLAGGLLWTLFDDSPEGRFGEGDYWLVRTDSHGTKIWETSFGSVGRDALASLQQLKDGSFILGGTSYSSGGNKTSPFYGGFDYWLLKLSAEGHRKPPFLKAFDPATN